MAKISITPICDWSHHSQAPFVGWQRAGGCCSEVGWAGRAGAVGGASAHAYVVPPLCAGALHCWEWHVLWNPKHMALGVLCLSDQGDCPVSFTGPYQIHQVAGWRLVLHVPFQTKLAYMLLETAAWCRWVQSPSKDRISGFGTDFMKAMINHFWNLKEVPHGLTELEVNSFLKCSILRVGWSADWRTDCW